MKILHTADWHLGKRLERFSRLEEQREVLDEICQIANEQEVDAVLIAGDLYDTFNPSTEATELLYKTLKKLSNNGKRAIIAIAGNHDSPERVDAPDVLARECGIFFAGYPNTNLGKIKLDTGLEIINSDNGFIELKLPEHTPHLRLLLTPYANEVRLKTMLNAKNSEQELRDLLQQKWSELANQYCDNTGVNILMAHLFFMKKGGEIPEEPDDEKPILHIGGAQAIFSENIPQQMQYVALGHLHRFQTIDSSPCPVIYSSSPLCYSFSEAGQSKFVAVLTAEPGTEVKIEKIALTKGKSLVRKRFDQIDLAIDWLSNNPDCLVELTIVSDEYLKSIDRKRLEQAHDGIVTLIPEIKNQSPTETANNSIDLSQDVDTLFIQYFKHKKGQEPNEELLSLFKELKAEDAE
ncbi:metallophosphoesterase family protein [Solitalea lacus]|uniref:metallophosphoesterase family protein n=1 Tax=Solitalea lacus TaxID=2911172 RepID=UPI001EDA659B|nr:exonuclease subunit SbcD [Solitalea lacus]UKJ09057.1 exonuclease subunit SbcD [Solitalea lacus]